MDKDQIIEIVKQYALKIKDIVAFDEISIFGSWAKGTATAESDIDVAVLVKKEPEDFLGIESSLWSRCIDVDLRIEPLLVVDKDDPAGFRNMAKRTGIPVSL